MMKLHEMTLTEYRQLRAKISLGLAIPFVWIAFTIPATVSMPNWVLIPWVVSFGVYFLLVVIHVLLGICEPGYGAEKEWAHKRKRWKKAAEIQDIIDQCREHRANEEPVKAKETLL